MSYCKINWNQVYEDPTNIVGHFVEKNFNEISNELKQQILELEKENLKLWNSYNDEINSIEELIKQTKKDKKISNKKWKKFGYIFLFCITLGIAMIFLWSAFKSLNKELKDFQSWKDDKNKAISDLKKRKIDLMSNICSHYKVRDLYGKYLDKVNIQLVDNQLVLPTAIISTWEHSNINKVGIKYEPYLIKNKFHTLVSMEYLETKLVQTSATKSWTVTRTNSDGDSVSYVVTYTAYHQEPTPYYHNTKPSLILKSNFDWDFTMNSKGSMPKKIALENDQFNKEYIVRNSKNSIDFSTGDLIKLRELFSILTQENLANYAKLNNKNFNVCKKNKTLAFSNTNNNLQSNFYSDKNLDLFYSYKHDETLENILDKFNLTSSFELNELLVALAGIYSFITFANEDTSGTSNHYKIRNYVEEMDEDCEINSNLTKYMGLALIGQLDHLNFIPSSSKENVLEKYIPLTNEEPQAIGENTWIVPLHKIWFTTELLYDFQTVGSFADGFREVAVPYTRYNRHDKKIYAIFKGPYIKTIHVEDNEETIFDDLVLMDKATINNIIDVAKNNQLYCSISHKLNSAFLLGSEDIEFMQAIATLIK